jgi:hypothetical protein
MSASLRSAYDPLDVLSAVIEDAEAAAVEIRISAAFCLRGPLD